MESGAPAPCEELGYACVGESEHVPPMNPAYHETCTREKYEALCITLTWFRERFESFEAYAAVDAARAQYEDPDEEGCMLDPLHPGLLACPFEVEDMVWHAQLERSAKGLPPLVENPKDKSYLVAAEPRP